jgi:hypothetical protein
MAFLAIESAIDDIAGIHQRIGDLAVQVLVILDDEYAHSLSWSLTEIDRCIGRFQRW